MALGADRGLLVLGPSGAGKSALALQLMALGAQLVADDRTEVTATQTGLYATCPPAIAGLIEARGVGILNAPALPRARLVLAVDLGQTESDRLPPFRSVTIMGTALPLVLGSQSAHFPSALLCYLQGGRHG
ncbi:HPr kinase/phosphorylase [Fuscibacter oryzae]|uniref:HPr kinase/phosphorylase n=1 Tax=Fuscibacter oryzae TaxID=2803939 RepID=UPI002E2D162B|nr:HPr kinase/phosphatase C-terminal domain-containing protein [Fuscibacter oryzae]